MEVDREMSARAAERHDVTKTRGAARLVLQTGQQPPEDVICGRAPHIETLFTAIRTLLRARLAEDELHDAGFTPIVHASSFAEANASEFFRLSRFDTGAAWKAGVNTDVFAFVWSRGRNEEARKYAADRISRRVRKLARNPGRTQRNDNELASLLANLVHCADLDAAADPNSSRPASALHPEAYEEGIRAAFAGAPRAAENPAPQSCAIVLRGLDPSSHSKDSKAVAERFEPLASRVPLARPKDGWGSRLRSEFPWMTGAIDAIEADAALFERYGAGHFRFRPILLVGPPGTGKSRFARRLGELAGVPSRRLNAGGASDDKVLRATSKGYASTHPWRPLETILQHRIANPVVFVDEIDKTATGRHNGNVLDALMDVLEPENASRIHDDCLDCEADLSHCSWILAANDESGLPAAFLSRVRVVRCEPPSDEHVPSIVEGAIADLAREVGAKRSDLPTPSELDVERLRRAFAAKRSLRDLVRATEAFVRRAPATSEVRHDR
ncbi:hypothetical protein CKO28_13420 [Rhodovibrio sodomensis]|uniref:AAA+ ATPase domain-containing protein n=1 Tax=Rhodovibrio sodomensis TaxID=1088 RepID=A0ABS1DFZ5_9PROT|nr:AAA family ATPase [Rhodovibrio sodomensis]MBK1669032.1 hypothetical protein [Rhodovibrio sodomensis]